MSNQAAESLSEKVSRVFGRMSIDKRRLPASQLQRRGCPAYVGEWLLDSLTPGTGALTFEEAHRVQEWAGRYIPGPTEQKIIKYRISQGERVKVLTPVQVEVYLRKNRNERLAQLSLLALDEVQIPDEFLNRHPDLLRQGMWGVADLLSTSGGVAIVDFRPMQATLNIGVYKKARQEFTLDEWQDLIVTSMGYNPSAFTEKEKSILIMRLLPLVQKNLHLLELAPKGTGKSYFYENVHPKVRLISGGNVSPAVLFVNNASGQWGLLARFAVLVLDEVQTLKFQQPEEIVGGLKGYLANNKLTRGGLHETGSDCSLVMMANIALDEQQKPVTEPLVRELPGFLQETAFLDRIKGIIPGWELRKLSGDCFATSAGLKSDFFGDALLALRNEIEADEFVARKLRFGGERSYRRNEDAVRAIAAGLLRILFPHGRVSDADFKVYCLDPAIRLRQLVYDQLFMLDAEYRQYDANVFCTVVPDSELPTQLV
jgi:ATP-dependent Lon protease